MWGALAERGVSSFNCFGTAAATYECWPGIPIASGVSSTLRGTRSFATFALNLYKGNTLRWRARAEQEIRTSGLDYTIVRAGVLVNRPAGRRAIVVTQEPLPLSFRHWIARADVAEAFVAALRHPRASRATFDIVWGKGRRRDGWATLLDRLERDGVP